MIELEFNPYTNTGGTAKIFKHPIVAKFYLLWRANHLTSQMFNKRCELLMTKINPDLDVNDYTIKEFIEALQDCSLANSGFGWGTADVRWVISNWDYFNPNIRRTLEFKHKFRREQRISKIN